MSDWVQIGEIGKPHGIRGGFWLIPHSDFVEWVAEQAHFTLFSEGQTRSLEVKKTNLTPQGRITVEFKEINDRSEIENLRGEALFVPEDQARQALQEEEFLNSDLVGLEVLENNQVIGKVIEMIENPAHPILNIQIKGGSSFLLPFTHKHVPEINIDEGRIIVQIPEGLKELQ